jgi:hypothetical protein
MAEYWATRPRALPDTPPPFTPSTSDDERPAASFLSEFDRHRLQLVLQSNDEEWQSELRRYLDDVPADVTRDIDIVKWWQVCRLLIINQNLNTRHRYRTMQRYIQHLLGSPSMCYLVKRRLFRVNGYSRAANSRPQIIGRDLGHNYLRNSS